MPREVAVERLERLQAAQRRIAAEALAARAGRDGRGPRGGPLRRAGERLGRTPENRVLHLAAERGGRAGRRARPRARDARRRQPRSPERSRERPRANGGPDCSVRWSGGALIFWASSQPNPFPLAAARPPLDHDKLLHAAAYAVLGALVLAALGGVPLRPLDGALAHGRGWPPPTGRPTSGTSPSSPAARPILGTSPPTQSARRGGRGGGGPLLRRQRARASIRA